MKARRVKGIEPAGSLVDGMRRIVDVRLTELVELAPAALESHDARALHDLRIAAKRLRYVLELAEPCLGDAAARGARWARALQDVLGDIHDCDVLAPLVAEHAGALRAADADALSASADTAADPGAVAGAPAADLHAGLTSLAIHLAARRQGLYARFKSEWRALEEAGIEGALRQRIAG